MTKARTAKLSAKAFKNDGLGNFALCEHITTHCTIVHHDQRTGRVEENIPSDNGSLLLRQHERTKIALEVHPTIICYMLRDITRICMLDVAG